MNEKQLYLVLAFIAITGLMIRLIPLRFNTLMEPDNYYYYSIIQQMHGMAIPHLSLYDGVAYSEHIGLVMMPKLLNMLTAIPTFTIMQWLAPIFGFFTIILTFIFARLLFKKNNIALLSSFFVAFIPAALNYTMAGAYRGDSFVNVILLLLLIMILKISQSNTAKHKIMHYFTAFPLFIFLILAAYYLWKGGIFITIILSLLVFEYITFILTKRSPKLMGILIGVGIIIFVILLILFFPFSANNTIIEAASPNITNVLGTFSGIVLLPPFLLISPALLLPLAQINYTLPILILGFIIAYLAYRLQDKSKFNTVFWVLATYTFITFTMNAIYIRFSSLSIIPIAIITSTILVYLTDKLKGWKVAVFALIILITIFQSVTFMATIYPQNNLSNQQYQDALSWLKNNSAQNSTVISFWSDGSEIEGIANRYAYADTVAAQGNTIVDEWLLSANRTPNFTPKADYVLVRQIYLNDSYAYCGFIDWGNCTDYNNSTWLMQNEPNYYVLTNANHTLLFQNVSYILVYINNDTSIFKIQR